MKTISINHFRTGQILFEGRFATLRQTVEAAISDGISLAFANLSHANLVNAQMDGAILDGALLDYANLLGANISEASLRRASFKNAHMHSVVLCESILDAVDFEGTLFGATDISGAHMKRCQFDSLSAMDLNFIDTASMERNIFKAAQDDHCEFSRPPLVLKGLAYLVACLDHRLLIGHQALANPTASATMGLPPNLSRFLNDYHPVIDNLWQTYLYRKAQTVSAAR